MTPDTHNALTDVPNLLVGHWSDPAHGTGCTVILAPGGACCGVDVRGSAPGTRETELLNPINRVDRAHGVLLSGGSAFGLGAAQGIVRWLAERGHGWWTPAAPVPIVPAAILYDLGFNGSTAYPTDENAYSACQAATSPETSRGSVGAGVGCTVGKLLGIGNASRGGLGQASLTLPGGAVVAALIAVNAFGDVVDAQRGELVAGARDAETGALVDSVSVAAQRFDSFNFRPPPVAQNTTIGVVATNLALNKAEATKLAQMAQSGVTRSTRPAHTAYDGDCLFALATGEQPQPFELSLLGAVAADVISAAILDAVRSATSAPGFPAAPELTPRPLATADS